MFEKAMQTIEALTAAITTLAAAMNSQTKVTEAAVNVVTSSTTTKEPAKKRAKKETATITPDDPLREAGLTAEQPDILDMLGDSGDDDLIDDAELLPPQLTYDDVVGAFSDYFRREGRDAAVKVMKKFGIVGKVTPDQLTPDKYQAFYEACK